MMKKDNSYWWWFDSHNSSKKSPWLHSTLDDLENKTKGMLKLIEEDAETFAQRAEMYYQKRPELVSMVEDFYRMHRSLAEKYDLLKCDVGNRMVTSMGSPFSTKSRSEKSSSVMDRNFDSQSETYDHEDYCPESEVDDPEHEDEAQIDEDTGEFDGPDEKTDSEAQIDEETGKFDETDKKTEDEAQADEDTCKVNGPDEKTEQQAEETATEHLRSASSVTDREMVRLKEETEQQAEETATEHLRSAYAVTDGEMARLKEEVERLKGENMVQKDQLVEKDEEKREVIRQLCLAMEMLRSENVSLRKFAGKKRSRFELIGKIFNRCSDS